MDRKKWMSILLAGVMVLVFLVPVYAAEEAVLPVVTLEADQEADFSGESVTDTDVQEDMEKEQYYSLMVSQTAGGTLMADHDRAAAGEAVFISYITEEGYCFSHVLVNGAVADLDNGYLLMPAEDVVLSAVFEWIAPESTLYGIHIMETPNGIVTADRETAAAGEIVSLSVTPAEGYRMETLLVGSGETVVEVSEHDTFLMPEGEVMVSASFCQIDDGDYYFSVSPDVSASEGDLVAVSVAITGHSDPDVRTYHTYDITLTFDSQKLKWIRGEGAVPEDQVEILHGDENTIRIVGSGGAKTFDRKAVTLTFQTIAAGEAGVTVSKMYLSDKNGLPMDEKIHEAVPGTGESIYSRDAEDMIVCIVKEENQTLLIDVREYIKLDGRSMFLITARKGSSLLMYHDQLMVYSDQYTVNGAGEAGAYCWLVISDREMNTMDLVKAAAEGAVTEAGEDVAPTVVSYDCDINQTDRVDVNDAQLVYDMYNASYKEFTGELPVRKFLEADMNADGSLDVHDITRILHKVLENAQ